MLKTDEQIKADWQLLDNADIDEVCKILRLHESRILHYLADSVAALCGVDVGDMLSDTQLAPIAQARWLFWYSYRYMTGETLEKISEMTVSRGGHRFTRNGIGQCINKMAAMIDKEPLWLKRWTIIKRIIKLRDEASTTEKQEKVAIQIPKELKGKVRFEIKEI